MKVDEETEPQQCMVGEQGTVGIKELREALTGCEDKNSFPVKQQNRFHGEVGSQLTQLDTALSSLVCPQS